jgi:hypothetical protein
MDDEFVPQKDQGSTRCVLSPVRLCRRITKLPVQESGQYQILFVYAFVG